MGILQWISGPLIGALIGYCTNYIAVKMLFRPLKEIRIGRFTLPFTPGLIPKRKDELAASIGKTISASLLTEEALADMLLSEDMERSVTDMCMEQFYHYLETGETLEKAAVSLTGDEAYKRGRTALKEKLSVKIMESIQEMEPGKLVEEEGRRAIRARLDGTMFSRFVSDKLVSSIAGEVGNHAQTYIMENGPLFVEQALEKELSDLEKRDLREAGGWAFSNEAFLRSRFKNIYRHCVEKFAGSIVKEFRISEIVEEKIRRMDVQELESLVMSVMKRELGMIVNLGALIGFLLGIFNLLF